MGSWSIHFCLQPSVHSDFYRATYCGTLDIGGEVSVYNSLLDTTSPFAVSAFQMQPESGVNRGGLYRSRASFEIPDFVLDVNKSYLHGKSSTLRTAYYGHKSHGLKDYQTHSFPFEILHSQPRILSNQLSCIILLGPSHLEYSKIFNFVCLFHILPLSGLAGW